MEMLFLEEVKKEQAVMKGIDEETGPTPQLLYSVSVDLEEAVAVLGNSPRTSFCSASTLLNLDLQLVENIFNLTFDEELALMILSVSFTWTVAVCTVFALTPRYVWTRSSNLAVEGLGLLFIGSLLMFVCAQLARMADAQVDADCEPVQSAGSPCESICFDDLVDLATNQEVKENDSRDNDKISIIPCNAHVRIDSGTTTATCYEDNCNNIDEESWSDPDNFVSA